VAIVGAGAAGLATAIFTRRFSRSQSVVLLDSARAPGAKILVSGGSRCNVTNATVTEHDFCGGRPSVIRRVLRAFSVSDTIAFFREIGVGLHEDGGGGDRAYGSSPGTRRPRPILPDSVS
jgi:predicted flavoprotein YhiN